MTKTNYKKALIVSCLLSANAAAGVINFNENVTLGDILNQQNPTINGGFDISSVLSDYNNEDVTILDAALNLYGYSNLNTSTSINYEQYQKTSSYNRRVNRGYTVYTTQHVTQGYKETYKCGFLGWSNCSRWVDTSYTYQLPHYVDTSYYVTDSNYQRDVTTNVEDLVKDEMMLSLAGQDFFASALNSTITLAKVNSQVQRFGGGFSARRTNITDYYLNTETYFGDLKLELDISNILAETLSIGDTTLDWDVFASLGQFNLNSISLDINYNKVQRAPLITTNSVHNTAVSVPEPVTLFLLGAGLGIGALSRKNKNKS